MHHLARTLLVVVVTFALVASAEDPGGARLEGELRFGGRLDEKGSPVPGRSHLYLSLTNDAAKALYESLDTEARDDPCTGYRLKDRGNVGCYEVEPGQRYFCSFSIDLERGVVEAGLGGCI